MSLGRYRFGVGAVSPRVAVMVPAGVISAAVAGALVALLATAMLAFLVMVLVMASHVGDSSTSTTTTTPPGVCAPFCGTAVDPAGR